MDTGSAQSEQKLFMVMDYVPMGLAGVDAKGNILHLNAAGRAHLQLFSTEAGGGLNNLFPILQRLKPEITESMLLEVEDPGHVLSDVLYSLVLPGPDQSAKKHFSFSMSRIFHNCYIVCFEDITDRYENATVIQQLVLDKAVAQGKSDLACDVLHDIGNAVVGFGLHL